MHYQTAAIKGVNALRAALFKFLPKSQHTGNVAFVALFPLVYPFFAYVCFALAAPHIDGLTNMAVQIGDEFLCHFASLLFYKQLEALPEDLRRAHLHDDWDVHAGQYFREFSREKHVCAPFEIPAWWRRFRSMDWGYNDPCCVLWHAVDGEGRVYTYRELYVRQRRAGDVAAKICELSKDENIAYTVASPDMWQNRGALLKANGGFEGESIAELFALSGVALTPADNSRVPGWQRVREFLSPAADGKSAWQAFDACTNLIRTLPLLIYDAHNREDVADGDDHAREALRYALMSRPRCSIKTLDKTRKAYNPLSTPVPQKDFMAK